LNIGGRLLAIVGRLPVMHAELITRSADAYDTRSVFDTVVAAAPGAVPSSQFKF
jgi:hypothetical protein